MLRWFFVGVWLTWCLGCITARNQKKEPLPRLNRTACSHHQAGSVTYVPETITSPDPNPTQSSAPNTKSISLSQVEQSIRNFQLKRRSTAAQESAWVAFLDVVLAYLQQPTERLHISPLIRARVAAEFELDVEQRREGGASKELELLVARLLQRIDYQMARLRALHSRGTYSSPPIPDSSPFCWPLSFGLITSGFGTRKDPLNPDKNQFHNGIDLAAPPHEPVYAAAAGKVVFEGWSGGAGRMVRIRHDNKSETLYAHLSTILVEIDQEVSRGEVIALIGRSGRATGHHLHFAIYINEASVDPIEHLPPIPLSFSNIYPGIAFGYPDEP